MALDAAMLSVVYAGCHLCWVCVFIVVLRFIMLSVIMLNVVMLGVVAPSHSSLIFVEKTSDLIHNITD